MLGKRAAAALALSLAAGAANATSLDVTSSYKMNAEAWHNLGLDRSSPDAVNDRSFVDNDARLGVAVRGIELENRGGEEETLDIGLKLHALGVAGSTVPAAAPFNRAAAYYPSADLTPFIENAYLRVHHLFGRRLSATFGRQSFRLGSGLLLDDDGAGLTGVSVSGKPWGDLGLEGFYFNSDNPNPNVSKPNSLDLFGMSLSLPTDGLWQLNQLFERDRSQQTLDGGWQISKALR
ncbi:MAG: hypothetical protein KGK30_03360, partial [Elusimicrobia bacterium]|nr:hypothetical protein [Elusimicrobiota bacterium]